jgi:hypothetical protein
MKNAKALLFQTVLLSTLSLQAFCKVDSLVYPQYSIDTEGSKIVIISESQEKYFTGLYLQSKKDSTILSLKQQYIDQLEHQLSLSKAVDKNKSELITKQESIISLNREEIRLLRDQASNNKKVIASLDNQVEQRNKVMKRRILGWKIATGVTIGVSVAVITGAAIILSR